VERPKAKSRKVRGRGTSRYQQIKNQEEEKKPSSLLRNSKRSPKRISLNGLKATREANNKSRKARSESVLKESRRSPPRSTSTLDDFWASVSKKGKGESQYISSPQTEVTREISSPREYPPRQNPSHSRVSREPSGNRAEYQLEDPLPSRQLSRESSSHKADPPRRNPLLARSHMRGEIYRPRRHVSSSSQQSSHKRCEKPTTQSTSSHNGRRSARLSGKNEKKSSRHRRARRDE